MSQEYVCSFPGYRQIEDCDWHVEGMLCSEAGRIWTVAFVGFAFLVCGGGSGEGE